MFATNLRTVYLAVRAVVPQMIQQNFGRIITTSSGAILNGGGAGIAAYAISKGAVRQFTEILADELKPHNIHAHCILPGTMDTPANRRDMPKSDFSKWVKVEDVASVVRFLLSDDAQAVRSVSFRPWARLIYGRSFAIAGCRASGSHPRCRSGRAAQSFALFKTLRLLFSEASSTVRSHAVKGRRVSGTRDSALQSPKSKFALGRIRT